MSKKLQFIPRLVELIKNGKKSTTFQVFDDKDLQIDDDLILVNSETDEVFGYAKISDIFIKPLNRLTVEDWEGHEGLEEGQSLIDLIRTLYKVPIDDDEQVKVVRFKLLV